MMFGFDRLSSFGENIFGNVGRPNNDDDGRTTEAT